MMSIIVFFILAALVLIYPEVMLKAIAAVGMLFALGIFLILGVVLQGMV